MVIHMFESLDATVGDLVEAVRKIEANTMALHHRS